MNTEFYPKNNVREERRGAPRHQVGLNFSIQITAVEHISPGVEEYFILAGQLIDVSLSGFAVSILNEDLRELQLLGNSVTLLLTLPLPAQLIELEAVPVRFQPLADSRALLGAQITNMNGRDRILFIEFINKFDSINFNRINNPNSNLEK